MTIMLRVIFVIEHFSSTLNSNEAWVPSSLMLLWMRYASDPLESELNPDVMTFWSMMFLSCRSRPNSSM
jgi:hypothetical protein